jgi:glutamyl-Q tRNA(Asp) synthetase
VSDVTSDTRYTGRYVGRFAPSPTGSLHFGSLVAALASYVDAKANNGLWLVRIEDVDSERCSREHEATILAQLSAYGFVHNGEIARQSERAQHYRAALARLQSAGLTYRCRCSRKRLSEAPRNREGESIYPGTCRDLGLTDVVDAPISVRLNLQKLHDATSIWFADRAFGDVAQNVRDEIGDFVLHRADGDFAYQLAVVVDDALQGITHVVRGADLLSNTTRQIVLQRALDLSTPSYLHVPIATNERGEKLSKQTRAAALSCEPKATMQTLIEAWSFLRQEKLPDCETPSQLLQSAVAQWRPERLCVSRTSFAANVV